MVVPPGYGAGDFIAIGQLAWKVYKNAKNSSEEFGILTQQMASLQIVLKEIVEAQEEFEVTPSQRERAQALESQCDKLVNDIDTLLKHYESLGTSAKKTWDRLRWDQKKIDSLRDRLVLQISLLDRYQMSLKMSDVKRMIEEKFRILVAEYQHGNKDPSIAESVHSAKQGVEESWDELFRQISKNLEDQDLSPADINQNVDLLTRLIVESVNEGHFDERPVNYEEPISLSTTDPSSFGGIVQNSNQPDSFASLAPNTAQSFTPTLVLHDSQETRGPIESENQELDVLHQSIADSDLPSTTNTRDTLSDIRKSQDNLMETDDWSYMMLIESKKLPLLPLQIANYSNFNEHQFESLLEASEKVYGVNDKNTLNIVKQIADCHVSHKEWNMALKMYTRIVESDSVQEFWTSDSVERPDLFGHILYLEAIMSIGTIYYLQNDIEAAKDSFSSIARKVVQGRWAAKLLPRIVISILHNLSRIIREFRVRGTIPFNLENIHKDRSLEPVELQLLTLVHDFYKTKPPSIDRRLLLTISIEFQSLRCECLPKESPERFSSVVEDCEKVFGPLAEYTLYAKIELSIAMSKFYGGGYIPIWFQYDKWGSVGVLLSNTIKLLSTEMIQLRANDKRTVRACADSAMHILEFSDALNIFWKQTRCQNAYTLLGLVFESSYDGLPGALPGIQYHSTIRSYRSSGMYYLWSFAMLCLKEQDPPKARLALNHLLNKSISQEKSAPDHYFLRYTLELLYLRNSQYVQAETILSESFQNWEWSQLKLDTLEPSVLAQYHFMYYLIVARCRKQHISLPDLSFRSISTIYHSLYPEAQNFGKTRSENSVDLPQSLVARVGLQDFSNSWSDSVADFLSIIRTPFSVWVSEGVNMANQKGQFEKFGVADFERLQSFSLQSSPLQVRSVWQHIGTWKRENRNNLLNKIHTGIGGVVENFTVDEYSGQKSNSEKSLRIETLSIKAENVSLRTMKRLDFATMKPLRVLIEMVARILQEYSICPREVPQGFLAFYARRAVPNKYGVSGYDAAVFAVRVRFYSGPKEILSGVRFERAQAKQYDFEPIVDEEKYAIFVAFIVRTLREKDSEVTKK